MIPDGIVRPGTHRGEIFGLTPDRFEADSYLWRTHNEIMISLIFAKGEGQGYFSALLNHLWGMGFTIKVPTPLGHMEQILIHKGFVRTIEFAEEMQSEVEVWVKGPPAP